MKTTSRQRSAVVVAALPKVAGNYAGKAAPARQRERREKLIAAGIRLIGTQGFAATSIDAVCSEAGLTKRYFYENFEHREALLQAAFRQGTGELLGSLMQAAAPHRGDARALVDAGVRATFTFVRAHPHEGRLIMIEALAVRGTLGRLYVERFGAFVDLLLGMTRPFLPQGIVSDTELVVMGRGAIGALIHLCQSWIATDFKQPIEELVAGTVRIFAGLGRELGNPAWHSHNAPSADAA